MKDILDIIDAALERKGLSAAAASRLAVGNPSLIKNMRAGPTDAKRFNSSALKKLAEILDLEFYFGEARGNTTLRMPGGISEYNVESLSSAAARQEALEMGFLPIPYHSAAAPDFKSTAPVALSRGWLKISGFATETLAFLPVISDTMTPTLRVGALALIDTSRNSGDGDGIWALSIKGTYSFSRIQKPGKDIVILKSDKPDVPVQIYTGRELATLKLLGQVVWIAHQP